LCDDVSTDEITPAWACFYFDERIAHHVYTGLRGQVIPPGAVAAGRFEAVVSGRSKGCGSSREAAPYAEKKAGLRFVFADSFEKIYRQNCENIGLYLSCDRALLERLVSGESVPVEEFTAGLDPMSAEIVHEGGLFAYNKARLAGLIATNPTRSAPSQRPMTLAEKIIARHAVVDARSDQVGVPAVTPGDAHFVRADVRFSHEYVTAMADALFRSEFGPDAAVRDPASVYLFRDHLTLLDGVMPEPERQRGLGREAGVLEREQRAFGARHGLTLYGEVMREGRVVGSEAICHNKVIEDIALPGQIVAGTDSHTCMAGVLGCLAFGVGSTDIANAWYTGDVRLKVPESVRVVLEGRLGRGVCAKDVMLDLLTREYFKTGHAIGQVIEFSGPGLLELDLDERATLTNMSVEAGAMTGIVAADSRVIEHLVAMRGLSPEVATNSIVLPDAEAHYVATLHVDLGQIVPMVATPGDPKNGVSLQSLLEDGHGPRIDIAYGGSCTGGKKSDMDMYAAVLARAVAAGARVASGVCLYIQFGSQHIRSYAAERGYLDLFERAGAQLLDPSCGACIRAGPGVSTRPDQVTVSAVNRNFPGRSGPGRVYLASPWVVAASAIAGRLVMP
jgi:3-isopropylmalate/(R)-2-methylmalate dehydratase large subunit